MKIADAREMSDAELAEESRILRRQLFDLRGQMVTEKLEDPTLVIKAKRDIARVLTVIRERELAGRREAATGGGERP